MIRIETRKRKSPEISIAPLVDCVLLLLIFFLLTSSFSEKFGIKVSLPGSKTAQATEQDTLNIEMSDTGEIMFMGKAVKNQGLTAALKAVVSEEGKKPVFLIADRKVSIERAAEVIDSVRLAGIESVAIATRRSPQEMEP